MAALFRAFTADIFLFVGGFFSLCRYGREPVDLPFVVAAQYDMGHHPAICQDVMLFQQIAVHIKVVDKGEIRLKTFDIILKSHGKCAGNDPSQPLLLLFRRLDIEDFKKLLPLLVFLYAKDDPKEIAYFRPKLRLKKYA